MLIRKAEPKDFPEICGLFSDRKEFFLIYPNGSYPMTVEQLQELASIRSDLTVACTNDRIIGFANLYNLKPKQYVFVGNVVISPAHRGQGLGKKITQHMMNLAFCQYNLPQVRISVFCNNTPALLLYTQLEFEPYAIEAREDPNGKRLALLHMLRYR